MVSSAKKFHDYIYGRRFDIVTDHKPLLGLFTPSKQTPQILSPRMLHWTILLNAYDYDLIHRPGKEIPNADALSRLPLTVPEFPVPPPLEVLFLEDILNPPLHAEDIARMTTQDPILPRVPNWALGDGRQQMWNQNFSHSGSGSTSCLYTIGVFSGAAEW